MIEQGRPIWWAGLDEGQTRAELVGDDDFDVVIIGGGYTGLWTAYYLARSTPDLRVAVLEANHVGFGASGRNGGWLAASVPGSRDRFAAEHGRDATLDLVDAMRASVDEVLSVAADENIDMDAIKSGCVRVATTPAQVERLRSAIAFEQSWESGGKGWRMESPTQIQERIRIPSVLAGAFTPDCARINPAKLAQGLAAAVERLGVKIFEGTRVVEFDKGFAQTSTGRVNARHILRATEGFTCRLPGLARSWLPMNSSMIATEPLPPSTWEEIGWNASETLSDYAHAYAYVQKTADGRIAIGGRGRPYVYAGKFDDRGVTPPETIQSLQSVLHRLFPATAGVEIAAAWSGVLGVPRDWCAGVGYDIATGIGWAGGYTGQGVTATNLAARTLSDLVLGKKTHLTTLPWIDLKSRKWEPEPFRWLGVTSIYAAYRRADRIESQRNSPKSAFVAKIADRISGR
jgi:glycine/D-amino acid oxidase-like deaminating enzyme